jgi:hypothetical protein
VAAPDPDDVLQRLIALPAEDLLGLYVELVATDPDASAAVARALREQARTGRLDADQDELVPVLACCLVDAPGPRSVFHLAKALAAFGREAGMAAPYLVDHLEDLRVVDDESFWIFEGCLYALGYLGGERARAFVDKVAAEEPPRVVKAGAVYRGELEGVVRRARFAQAVVDVRALLDSDPQPWRARQGDLARAATTPKKTKTAPWMTRR